MKALPQGFLEFLRGLSVKAKLLILIAFLLVNTLLVGSIIAWLLISMQKNIETRLLITQEQLLLTTEVQQAITLKAKSKFELIAADDKDSIRKAAIGVIRSGAHMEESLKKLSGLMGDNPKVQEMLTLLESSREHEMKIIQEGKKNHDHHALETVAISDKKNQRIEKLASEIVAQEKQHLINDIRALKRESLKTIQNLAIYVAASSIILILLGLSLTTSIVRPLMRIENVMNHLSEGDLDISVGKTRQTNEVGRTLVAVEKTINNLKSIVSNISQASIMLVQQSKDINTLSSEVSHESQDLIQRSNNINEGILATVWSGDEASKQLGHGIELSKENIQSTKSAIQQIERSSKNFETLQNQINDSNDMMQQLSRETDAITDFVGTINNIADQTNLLALNAAIEAARAGDHGRGFAVVADEVRHLAIRTGEATTEIMNRINMIVDNVDQASDCLAKLSKIADGQLNIMNEVSGQSLICNEQTEKVSESMKMVIEKMNQQKQETEKIVHTANHMLESANESKEKVKRFLKLAQFVSMASDNMVHVVNEFNLPDNTENDSFDQF